jgi:hypothetical protein
MTEAGGSSTQGSSAWFNQMMQVRGFITQFTYNITNNSLMANQRMELDSSNSWTM